MIYRPRVHATLTVPVLGSSAEKDREAHATNNVTFPITIRSITIERNDHLLADTCHVTADYRDLNIDPRFLKHAIIQVWLGNAPETGAWTPKDKDFRFIGICTRANRKTMEGGLTVDMEFQDYTALFIAQKPYNHKALPALSMTLADAWRLICKNTGYWDVSTGELVSNVDALASNLVFRGVPETIKMSEAVSERLAKYGKISAKSGDSAWDIWQRCVFALGLVSWIEKDQCVVSTSTELFTPKTAPAIIYGENMLEADEAVDTTVNNKGIHLQSYDHVKGRVIEVFYPPPGDPRIKVKRLNAKGKSTSKSPDDIETEQYEVLYFHEVTDPGILLDVARRVYDERSRQEIQGYVKTAEMVVKDPHGKDVDLLNYGTGDCIRIQIGEDTKELLKNLGPEFIRIEYLIDRGYERGVATLIVKNLDAMPKLSPVFHTRRITTHLEDTGDSGQFSVTINYWNRILFSGDTDDTA